MKRLLLLLLFISFYQPAQAQPGATFFRISQAEGLAANSVLNIAQDQAGYLWMLSAHCLQRYDGYRFVNFYPGQGILPAGTIQAMHLDRQNRIWLCFQTLQTGYLSLADLSWHPVSLEAPPGAKGLEPSFFEKHDGNMLLFLKGEAMLTLGNQGKTFAQKFNAFQPPKGWRPISYWEDAAGNAWLSASAGLLKFNPHTRQLSYKGHNADGDAYIQMSENLETINGFFIDKKGIGWVLA